MMPARRPASVVITAHARERWAQYGGEPGRLRPGIVRRRLWGALRGGLPVSAGAVQVAVDGLRVVLVPRAQGGWVAVTVLERRRESA